MNAASQQGSKTAGQSGPGHYRDLIARQKGMALARQVYLATERMTANRSFGWTVQMLRSAVSVPSNIAEGHARQSDRAPRMFLGNPRGSLFELETQTLLAADRTYINRKDADALLARSGEVARNPNGLLRTLEVDEAPHAS